MTDRLMGIVYNGTGKRGKQRGARAVLVLGDIHGYHHLGSKQRWRPTVAWAAWTAKRWAVKENLKRDRQQEKTIRVNSVYYKLLREQGGLNARG